MRKYLFFQLVFLINIVAESFETHQLGDMELCSSCNSEWRKITWTPSGYAANKLQIARKAADPFRCESSISGLGLKQGYTSHLAHKQGFSKRREKMFLLLKISRADGSRSKTAAVNSKPMWSTLQWLFLAMQFHPGETRAEPEPPGPAFGLRSSKVPQSEAAGQQGGRPTLHKGNCTLLKRKHREREGRGRKGEGGEGEGGRVKSQWTWLAGTESDGSVMEPDSCSTPKKEGGAAGSIARIGGLTH